MTVAKVRKIIVALVLAGLVWPAAAADRVAIDAKTLTERQAWGDRELVVLDVRTPEEYAAGHVPGAINIPHTALAARLAELEGHRERDIVVYCRSGNRTQLAIAELRKAGFKRLLHLEGDYLRWAEEGRPVTRKP